MILTQERMDVHYDILTAISRLHMPMGCLYPSSDAIAAESGYTPKDTRLALGDAEGMGWVSFSIRRSGWRLSESVVALVPRIHYCEPCRVMEHQENRAIAEARSSDGMWVNVCSRHFYAYDCRLGPGLGQILRFEY